MSWLPDLRLVPSPRRRVRLVAGALTAVLGVFWTSTLAAQVLLLPESAAAPVFPVGALELEYALAHPDLPSLAQLVPVRVELTRTPLGWAAPREGDAREELAIGAAGAEPVPLEASGLARVLRAIVAKLHERGLYGLDVRPASRDIDLETERDLRPPERTALALVVHVGRIQQIRTIAVGDRIRGDWKIDNALHARIRERSPLQPAGIAGEETTDLVDRRRLEDYLFRLNRHAGRRVEAALSPAEEPGGVVLDYRVGEAKPWYVFAQVTNTGTPRTSPWQTRVGAAHRQLTNRDDILSIEYLNAGLDDVNAISASYEAPFFGPERPDWMRRRKGDLEWLDWLPRERIPWWGVDRLRWGVDLSWSRSETGRRATIPGLANDRVRSDDLRAGGRMTYEVFQHRDFFVDLWGGLRLADLEVDNDVSATVGEALLLMPAAGLHAERINQISTFGADVSVQGNVLPIDEGELDSLGRDATDDRYVTLDWNLGFTTFLEPLLLGEAWRDPASERSSTLAHEVAIGFRGQYAFDYRLIPQSSRTIGGLYSVRGYDQSVGVGDSILVGSLEYRFHLPRALPVTREPLRLPLVGDFRAAPQQVYGRPDWDLTFRAFLDAGRAIRNDESNVASGINEVDQTLLGAGLGAELTLRSNFRARIDWATALLDTNGNISRSTEAGDSEIHVLFSILY